MTMTLFGRRLAALCSRSRDLPMNETTSLRWRSHAAKTAMNYHTLDGETTGDDDDDEKSSKSLSQKGRLCCGAHVMDGVAATAVASSMVTWMATSNILARTASVSTFLFGPFAAFQRRKLRNLGALRKQQNQLRSEVNYLHQEKERLQRSLQRLDSNIVQIERMERELNRIAGSPHQVNRLLEVVYEQKKLHERMKKNLKKSILQDVLGALVKSDEDKNFIIHSREMEVLVVRFNMMQGVKFQEQNFRQLVGSDSQSLSNIMRLIRNLLQDDDETVFVLCPEELTRR